MKDNNKDESPTNIYNKLRDYLSNLASIDFAALAKEGYAQDCQDLLDMMAELAAQGKQDIAKALSSGSLEESDSKTPNNEVDPNNYDGRLIPKDGGGPVL